MLFVKRDNSVILLFSRILMLSTALRLFIASSLSTGVAIAQFDTARSHSHLPNVPVPNARNLHVECTGLRFSPSAFTAEILGDRASSALPRTLLPLPRNIDPALPPSNYRGVAHRYAPDRTLFLECDAPFRVTLRFAVSLDDVVLKRLDSVVRLSQGASGSDSAIVALLESLIRSSQTPEFDAAPKAEVDVLAGSFRVQSTLNTGLPPSALQTPILRLATQLRVTVHPSYRERAHEDLPHFAHFNVFTASGFAASELESAEQPNIHAEQISIQRIIQGLEERDRYEHFEAPFVDLLSEAIADATTPQALVAGVNHSLSNPLRLLSGCLDACLQDETCTQVLVRTDLALNPINSNNPNWMAGVTNCGFLRSSPLPLSPHATESPLKAFQRVMRQALSHPADYPGTNEWMVERPTASSSRTRIFYKFVKEFNPPSISRRTPRRSEQILLTNPRLPIPEAQYFQDGALTPHTDSNTYLVPPRLGSPHFLNALENAKVSH